MLGTELEFRRVVAEDRFDNPAKARRSNSNQSQLSDQRRRAQCDVMSSRSKDKLVGEHVNRESEKRVDSTDHPKPVSVPSSESFVSPVSNLERFLSSIMPAVPALYLSKTTMRGRRTCDEEFQPYFMLGDLWESFKEWSAYGAGVPLILNGFDSVVQYYVPYLSGIQIYADSLQFSATSRQPDADSDSDFRDSCSDGSSDCEPERGLNMLRGKWNCRMTGGQIGQAPVVTCPNDIDGSPKMPLPVFGLVSYKYKSSLWTPNGASDRTTKTN
ncbi:hypothetical protein V6N13_017570 [Hibiscus sabdariffa]|uniref:Uncharacterized protein n=2 Tax=Hibiscus sabdariffa TaxID=183260 RepID=A0ABR2AH63_9ROSI